MVKNCWVLIYDKEDLLQRLDFAHFTMLVGKFRLSTNPLKNRYAVVTELVGDFDQN